MLKVKRPESQIMYKVLPSKTTERYKHDIQIRARQPKDINMTAKYGFSQLRKRPFRARQPKDINMIAKYGFRAFRSLDLEHTL
jgi:hypothetical protein